MSVSGSSPSAPPEDPLALFQKWLQEAANHEIEDPNAMCLATVDSLGRPHVRMMLLKSADADGFVFYTNLESPKGEDLSQNPAAALCFHWKSLGRQVRIEGACVRVPDSEADSYFSSRPRNSQIGAWVSRQSRPLASREMLEKAFADKEDSFSDSPIPRPPHWSGFRLSPERIEFWVQEEFRLHRRLLYTKEEGGWTTAILYP